MKLNLMIILFSVAVSLAAQTGGTLQIEKSVVGSGGSTSNGGEYSLESTTGQTSAGGFVNGSTYSLYAGFWAPDLAPTAAGVSVSGRVISSNGKPINAAIVVLTSAEGVICSGRSSSFGYYVLTDVEVGHTYIVTVESKRYQFEPRVVSILDEVTDLHLVALP